jgi:hypothetical protein
MHPPTTFTVTDQCPRVGPPVTSVGTDQGVGTGCGGAGTAGPLSTVVVPT